MIKFLIACIIATLFLMIGLDRGFKLGLERGEAELVEFWGSYYNVEGRGCYNCVTRGE